MPRAEMKQASKRKAQPVNLPLAKTNYQILGAGLLIILAGYVALAQQPWDGTMPLIVAPILLVVGYCIIIPYGILFRRKEATDADAASGDSEQQAPR